MTLNSLTASPGTPTSVSLTQTSLLSESPSQIYIYSILNPDRLIEINSNDFTYASPDLSFSYSFRTGQYGFKVWFEGFGWAEVSSDITVAAASAFTASTTSCSYLGGQLTVSGAFIAHDAILKIGAFSGKIISSTDSTAIFEIPELLTTEVLAGYPTLSSRGEHKLSGQIISDV